MSMPGGVCGKAYTTAGSYMQLYRCATTQTKTHSVSDTSRFGKVLANKRSGNALLMHHILISTQCLCTKRTFQVVGLAAVERAVGPAHNVHAAVAHCRRRGYLPGTHHLLAQDRFGHRSVIARD